MQAEGQHCGRLIYQGIKDLITFKQSLKLRHSSGKYSMVSRASWSFRNVLESAQTVQELLGQFSVIFNCFSRLKNTKEIGRKHLVGYKSLPK